MIARPKNLLPASAAALAAALVAATTNASAAGPSPQGIWIDSNGRGAVEIKPCGEALCGHVVWVKNTADAKGCGRQIIGDAAAAGKNTYEGWIYSPEDRKRYNVELSPMNDGRLRVVGYAGIRLFSKTMYWKPAQPDLVRCDSGSGAKPAPTQEASLLPPAAAKAAAETPARPASAATDKATSPAVTAAKAPPQPPAPAVSAKEPAKPEAKAAAAADSSAAPKSATTPDETAANEEGDAGGTESGPPDLGRLAGMLDKVVKRSANGDCKLDLPWVKVRFRCEDE